MNSVPSFPSVGQNATQNSAQTKQAFKSAFPGLEPANSQKSIEFMKSMMIESIDQEGRTSLRQIMTNDKEGRPSLLNQF